MATLPLIGEDDLSTLRKKIEKYVHGKRLMHTLAVEREAAALAEVYLPDSINFLRAAALLHDITKELSNEEQFALCNRFAIPLTRADVLSPRTLHAKTAAALIRADFSEYACNEITDAVAKHTTGASEMSLFARLLYLADYIEDTRTYPDCIGLRKTFWQGIQDLPREKYAAHLTDVLLKSFNHTICALVDEGYAIALDTVEARNMLIEEISNHN